jgi:uncharacterized protein YbjQ (UPF0145 family)
MVLVSTTNELPGQVIVEVLGEVMGLTVRSGMGANWTELCAYGTAARTRGLRSS